MYSKAHEFFVAHRDSDNVCYLLSANDITGYIIFRQAAIYYQTDPNQIIKLIEVGFDSPMVRTAANIQS